MPCYDPRGEKVDPTPYRNKIDDLNSKIKLLEAGLCALITELEKEGIASKVIIQASKSGLIDLVSFWDIHSKEDEVRLIRELHKFSEHEQSILKRILNSI